MKLAYTNDRRSATATQSDRPPANLQHYVAEQSESTHRPFDYDAGFGRRSGFASGRRYADFPQRGLFHCG